MQTIDRIFVYKRPYVFFKQPDVLKKHQDHFINCQRERYLTLKGAMANTQGGDGLHLRERKPTLP